ncbi:MAG: hypothetical protein ACW97A_13380 [Candidatus Thorarchaeota archaeon]|jgi:hypothetical protein
MSTGLPSLMMTVTDLGTADMMIDEGAFLVLRSAAGAFSSEREVFRMFLSNPVSTDSTKNDALEVSFLEDLPSESMIEVKHDSTDFSYYRRDDGMWTKVAVAESPFMLEVFTHGSSTIIMDIIQ